MTTCPKCGTRFSGHERLCPHDGTVLEPDQPSELKHIGKVLDNKYRLDSYLSRGGMGAVYRATHVMLGRPVAVKLINPDLVTTPDIVRRFQREARAVTHLNHPNIVEVYDLGQAQDGTLYIAMELVAGESLSSVIKSGGPLPPDRIVRILGQIVSALALAHRKEIVHRDLKPLNIMITRGDDGQDVAKLLDFGIAKTFEFDANTKLTATGSAIGTPQYMSPEQASGQQVDGRSDLYSLGIILYEMLVGEVPFSGSSAPTVMVKHLNELPVHPSRRRPDLHISPTLERIALRCLEKDPSQRFQTAGELAAELQRAPVEEADAGGHTIRLSPTVLDRARAGDGPTVGSTIPSPFHATPAWQPGFDETISNDKTVTNDRTISNDETIRNAPTLPSRPPEPGTKPTAPALVPAAIVAPPIVNPAVAPKRSLVAPIAGAVILLAVAGAAYWAMTRPAEVTPASVTAPPAPAATPAGAESTKPEPPANTAAATPPVTPPAASPPPTRETATAPSPLPPARSTAESARTSAPPETRSEPAPGAAAAAKVPPPAPAPAQPQANPIPATPSVSFECTGPNEVCSPLRQAIQETAEREGLVMTRASNKAVEFVVTAEVAIVDQRQQNQFGTSFVVTTYSIDISAESTRFNQDVPMPASKTFSADARTGRERLAENARVAAADAIERVQQFWKKRVP